MITSHCFLRSAWVGLILYGLLSLENSVHSDHQNISFPVLEYVQIFKLILSGV